MKRKINYLGIISLVAASGLSLAGCGTPTALVSKSAVSVNTPKSSNVNTSSSSSSIHSSSNATSSEPSKKGMKKSLPNPKPKKNKASLPSIKVQQQALAKLGYLPFDVTNNNLVWKYRLPKSLTSLWSYGTNNVIFQGAVVQFQHQANITVDGILGSQTWGRIQDALKHHLTDPYGYPYVFVSEKYPETLTLYYNGKVVLSTLANTGVPGATTQLGTYPVYLRALSTTMSGTEPDGQHYKDPGIPYVNYFYKGDAVHGYIRSSYGFPQSVGCVELPIPNAKTAYSYMHYGTLVTVASK